MEGQAAAPAAGTVLNALANGQGAAFAIDEYTRATVTLDGSETVEGAIAEDPDADTSLIERCVELVVERVGDGQGGAVRTESDVPMASGLKSSSAAANATVLATLDALDARDAVAREEAARIGVQAARDAGVTVTDNTTDDLLARETVEWDVLVWTPPARTYSAEADVSRCRSVAPVADLVAELALDGSYARAMTVNGLAFCAALGFSPDPLIEAMEEADGVSLSGTGPSFTAVGEGEALDAVRERWSDRDGTTWLTTTQTEGARVT